MKRWVCMVLACLQLLSVGVCAEEVPHYLYDTESAASVEEFVPVMGDATALQIPAKAAVLMDMMSGAVLFEQNSHEPLPIASVTKVMTLLLVMEAIDGGQLAYEQPITVSARAASMGGSQIWLEEHEQMTAEELLKAAVIVSANDACAALAEHLCGTLEAFTARMNERAKELGATDTTFVDCSGLDDSGVSSAHDIALISRELMMAHPAIQNYTTVWMDSLRGGQSELVNTNRLVRFYNGATGLKTGTTAAAGCCLSATAQRDGLPLCAVVLGAGSSDDRFAGARSMLDYGFANYTLYTPPKEALACAPLTVVHGTETAVSVTPPAVTGIPVAVKEKEHVTVRVEIPASVTAPVEKGQRLGEAVICVGEEERLRLPLTASAAVEAMTFARAVKRFLAAMTTGNAV